MGQIGYRSGAGQLRPITGEGRWSRASIVEEPAFLAEVRPTISDYLRSPVPLAPVLRLSNQGCITTNKQQGCPTDEFTPTARTTAERRVINTDKTTASALPDAVFVPVLDWIGEGPTYAVPPPSSTPPATSVDIHPPVPAEPPASVRPRRQRKPCRHYVSETVKWQGR